MGYFFYMLILLISTTLSHKKVAIITKYPFKKMKKISGQLWIHFQISSGTSLPKYQTWVPSPAAINDFWCC